MTESFVAQLADTLVLDLEGRPHPLGDHFRARPAALLFVRHFG